ncbi:cytochrome P450 [Actinoplanes sp. M2I2]|uniref:cytochrome P450 family protein n=1 Tax=Actinoplanes sp. M2I2 TaxID=1734444 RepID=UPI00201FE6EC|nr:cytochrome P450 [Actinoplanes sp. M2I2]
MFTPRRVEGLRPRIAEISDELLDAMAGQEKVDLLDAFAFPLPMQVICELLGIPAGDRDDFRAWSSVIVASEARPGEFPGAVMSMVAYLREILALRRATPGDDLLSALIEVRDSEDRLSEDELTSMVFLLLIAGYETMVNLLGNGTYLLLDQRERWEQLRAEPALLPTAIEEFLRFESSVDTATYRFPAEPVEIGGQEIPAYAPVMVSLLSANRDEARFPNAGSVQLDRSPNLHLAFAHGIHHCLGAPLARIEAQVAFAGLISRYPSLELAVPAADLAWTPGVRMRGLVALPVTLGQAAQQSTSA